MRDLLNKFAEKYNFAPQKPIKYKKSIELDKLKQYINPLENPPWTNVSPISKQEISDCISKKEYLDPQSSKRDSSTTRQDHIKRIAYLVVNKDSKPISLRIMNNINCTDGNHRLAAAIYREDEFVECYLTMLNDIEI